MKTLSEWLDKNIKRKELSSYSFEKIAPSSIQEYRKARRFPKYSAYEHMCEVLGVEATKEQYFEFSDNFVRNGKR